MLGEARGDLKATVGIRVKPDYHITLIAFCSFPFLSARFLCYLAGCAQKHVSTYWIMWAEARLRFEEHIFKKLFSSRLLLFFHENKPNDNKGISKHVRFCWQQLFGPLRNITISLKSIRPNKIEIKIIAEQVFYMCLHPGSNLQLAPPL